MSTYLATIELDVTDCPEAVTASHSGADMRGPEPPSLTPGGVGVVGRSPHLAPPRCSSSRRFGRADITTVPGTMSTAAVNTSPFAVPVPAGVEPGDHRRAHHARGRRGRHGLFRVNGRSARRCRPPSTSRCASRWPAGRGRRRHARADHDHLDRSAGTTACRPAGSRRCAVELDYSGTETAPTTLATSSRRPARVDVVLPGADDDMLEAGLTAVAALAYRYPDAPIELGPRCRRPRPPRQPARGGLVEGRRARSRPRVDHVGLPMLTLTGTGDALIDAARALSTRRARPVRADAENLSQETKPRSTADPDPRRPRDRPLAQRLRHDHPAFRAPAGRLRRPGLRDGPAPRGLAHRVHGGQRRPARRARERRAGRLDRARRRRDLRPRRARPAASSARSTRRPHPHAFAPDGAACAPRRSHRRGRPRHRSVDCHRHPRDRAAEGFQLYPQVFEGTLPVAIRAPRVARPAPRSTQRR